MTKFRCDYAVSDLSFKMLSKTWINDNFFDLYNFNVYISRFDRSYLILVFVNLI